MMFKRSYAGGLCWAISAALLCSPFTYAQAAPDPTPVIHVDNAPNTLSQQAKHYVILVSLDGFRYDYPAKFTAPHIQAMGDAGAFAPDGMRPSYPSLTFPNHMSIVTGLYPEHHGIIANSFIDPTRTVEQGQHYSYTDLKTSSDGSWYGGTPLWVLAEKQGMRAACLFWPGSEAEIQGKRPSYYLHYDDKLDDRKRVDQVIAWLSLPPEQRPHFITLYYSNVDHAGHLYGPDSDEVAEAVHHVDDMIGDLQAKLEKLNLPADLIVLADHGMVKLEGDPIDLSHFADLTDVRTEGSLLYTKDDAAAEKLYEQFKAHPDSRFNIYRRLDIPPGLHYDANSREGDPVIVPAGPYTFRVKAAAGTNTMVGGHGFPSLRMPEMKAIFYAQGPDIAPGVKLRTFTNVSVYPLIAQLLGLDAPRSDGDIHALMPALIDSMRPVGPASASGHQRDGVVRSMPQLIFQSEASFSEQARKKKIRGNVVIALTVDENGLPQNVRVERGLGYGLDEKAVEAVSQYRFRPATENGKPVAIEIHVEVNFQIF